MKIGIISDTHDYFDPVIARHFKGVDHILHGGDVGRNAIVLELEKIAPVTAVLGNTDDPVFGYRLTETVELAKTRFMVHHIVNPHAPSENLKSSLQVHKPRVLVFGHTHKPFAANIGEVFFFNPGYAGKSRFGQERSLGLIHLTEGRITHEFIPL